MRKPIWTVTKRDGTVVECTVGTVDAHACEPGAVVEGNHAAQCYDVIEQCLDLRESNDATDDIEYLFDKQLVMVVRNMHSSYYMYSCLDNPSYSEIYQASGRSPDTTSVKAYDSGDTLAMYDIMEHLQKY